MTTPRNSLFGSQTVQSASPTARLAATSALIALALSALSAPVWSQTVGPLTFDSASDFTNNFRTTQAPGTGPVTATGGFVEVSQSGGNVNWVGAYDTTPGDAGDAPQTFAGDIIVSFSISAHQANSSFGVFFGDGTTSNNLLALFNLDSTTGSAGAEQIRFFRDGNFDTGTAGTQYGVGEITGGGDGLFSGSSWVTSSSSSGNAQIDTSAPFAFYPLTFTYSPSLSQLTLAQGSFSATLNIPAADLILNPRLSLRVFDATSTAGSAKFDNFTVIPEPAAAGLLNLGALALGTVRRRLRK